MVDGQGDPNTSKEYSEAIQMLYGVSYTLKFLCKQELNCDYVVPPLEGLWWATDKYAFITGNKESWHWTMMLMIPPGITAMSTKKALDLFAQKKPKLDTHKIMVHSITEGTCIQIMHVGPYHAESATLKVMHDQYMPAHHLAFNGKHHEIYLNDPRKTEPAKLKTILRQPVKILG